MKLRIEQYGDRLVIPLPSEIAARLTWGHGDVVEAKVAGDGLQVRRTQTAHDHALEIARQVMEEYREVFETLAKT
jgi:antitoxin component of MazEF toxin-antitoxin module